MLLVNSTDTVSCNDSEGTEKSILPSKQVPYRPTLYFRSNHAHNPVKDFHIKHQEHWHVLHSQVETGDEEPQVSPKGAKGKSLAAVGLSCFGYRLWSPQHSKVSAQNTEGHSIQSEILCLINHNTMLNLTTVSITASSFLLPAHLLEIKQKHLEQGYWQMINTARSALVH